MSNQTTTRKRRRADDYPPPSYIASPAQVELEPSQLAPKHVRQFPTPPLLPSFEGFQEGDYGVRGSLDRYTLTRYVDGDVPAPAGGQNASTEKWQMDRENVCSFLVSTLDFP